jgi:hypothetical protein
MSPLILSEFDVVCDVDNRTDVQGQLNQQDKARLTLYQVLTYARLCLLYK